jgi:hypothetical protein
LRCREWKNLIRELAAPLWRISVMSHTVQRSVRFALFFVVATLTGGCAAPGPVPATVQPELARYAAPYANGLQGAGISSVMVYGNGARVRVASAMGEVYFRYPSTLPSTAFALYFGQGGVEVDSDTFNAGNSAQYETAMKTILPEAIRWTTENNRVRAQQALGEGGGRGGGR